MIGEMLATMSEESLETASSRASRSSTHDAARALHQHRLRARDRDRRRAHRTTSSKRIIGVGRLLGDPERGSGEFTVLVHDEFQGKGLGFKLVDLIIGIAEEKGFAEIGGTVTADNERMLALTEALGFLPGSTTKGVTKVCLELR